MVLTLLFSFSRVLVDPRERLKAAFGGRSRLRLLLVPGGASKPPASPHLGGAAYLAPHQTL